jgi:uncharacterized protein YjeT (DUF2065 family)
VIETFLTALGLVFVIEGLVFALAPSRVEDLLRMFAEIPVEKRRAMGLGAIALGVVLVWLNLGTS